MKNLLLLFLFVVLISSCNSIGAKFKIVKEKPPLDSDEPVFFFTYSQPLPDSAEYIGEMSTACRFIDLLIMHYSGVNRTIENEIRSKGANALEMFKAEESNKIYYLGGKLYKIKQPEHINIDIDSLKKRWTDNYTDKYEGIYEADLGYIGKDYRGKKVQFACINRDSTSYNLIYCKGFEVIPRPLIGIIDLKKIWKTGDVYAYMNITSNKNVFKSSIYTHNKSLKDLISVKYDEGKYICYDVRPGIYKKIYPDSASKERVIGGLTGFALDSHRIVTCCHGVTVKDTKIYVKGINKNFEDRHECVIECLDKVNDIAVIRVKDSSVCITQIPFSPDTSEKGIAEEVFVLGYPLEPLMGSEIKLTNGIISSLSGALGDETLYQITAPIQAGSSGSPLLCKSGELLGICQSYVSKLISENVNYAVKANVLLNFLKKNGYKNVFSSQNKLNGKSLADQVKEIKNYIYMLELVDTSDD